MKTSKKAQPRAQNKADELTQDFQDRLDNLDTALQTRIRGLDKTVDALLHYKIMGRLDELAHRAAELGVKFPQVNLLPTNREFFLGGLKAALIVGDDGIRLTVGTNNYRMRHLNDHSFSCFERVEGTSSEAIHQPYGAEEFKRALLGARISTREFSDLVKEGIATVLKAVSPRSSWNAE